MNKDRYAKSLAEYAHDRGIDFVPIAYCPLNLDTALLLTRGPGFYYVFAIEAIIVTTDELSKLPRVRLLRIHQPEDWLALMDFRDYCKTLGGNRSLYSVVSASYEEVKEEMEKLENEEDD